MRGEKEARNEKDPFGVGVSGKIPFEILWSVSEAVTAFSLLHSRRKKDRRLSTLYRKVRGVEGREK